MPQSQDLWYSDYSNLDAAPNYHVHIKRHSGYSSGFCLQGNSRSGPDPNPDPCWRKIFRKKGVLYCQYKLYRFNYTGTTTILSFSSFGGCFGVGRYVNGGVQILYLYYYEYVPWGKLLYLVYTHNIRNYVVWSEDC